MGKQLVLRERLYVEHCRHCPEPEQEAVGVFSCLNKIQLNTYRYFLTRPWWRLAHSQLQKGKKSKQLMSGFV